MQPFATANVNDIRIGWRNRDRADRSRWLIIENRLPGSAVIDRFETPAVHRRHVENIWLRRHAADRAGPPAAVGSNVSPAQNGIELSSARVRNCQKNGEPDYDCTSNQSHKPQLSSAIASDAML